MTPLKINTKENNKTASTPITSTIGSIGAKNPVSGAFRSAKPASIENKNSQIGLSIVNPSFSLLTYSDCEKAFSK
jgi:hypothetical protein